MLKEIEIPKSMGLIVRTAGSRKSQKRNSKRFTKYNMLWGRY